MCKWNNENESSKDHVLPSPLKCCLIPLNSFKFGKNLDFLTSFLANQISQQEMNQFENDRAEF